MATPLTRGQRLQWQIDHNIISRQKPVCGCTGLCPNDPKGDRHTGERKCGHCRFAGAA